MYKAWLFLRSTLFYMGIVPVAIAIGLLSPLLLLIPLKAASAIILCWNRFALWWLKVCCGLSYEVTSHLGESTKPWVVVCNHQCFWETIFLQLAFYPLATVLKKELLRIPFFGWGLNVLRPIAIDRSTPLQALKQVKTKGIERLKEGHNVLVFPEGTRMAYGELGDYKRSGADIAVQANVCIVPVAHNAAKFWPNKRYIKFPGTIQVVIGAPIDMSGKNTKVAMQEVQAWAKEQTNKMQ